MIKFADLQIRNQAAIDTVIAVMRSGKFINGVWNTRFGALWARECSVEECILTSSGTSALIATLKCTLRGRSNNYVIMPALSFAATAFAALEAGCQPIYVDVDKCGLIRWDQVDDIINQYGQYKIHAIIPVHLYGQYTPAPSHIKEKFYVIEDACQAHGVVQSPTIACFSFYPSKNLGAIGDAGAVVTNMSELAKRIRAYINYGDYPGEKYIHNFQGNNLRCDELQAAYLLEVYKYLEDNNTKRVHIASLYESNEIVCLANSSPSSHHLYPILVDNPGLFRRLLYDYGIETGNHYPYILPRVADGVTPFIYQQSEFISKHVVTLPIGQHLTDTDIGQVIGVIQDTCELHGDNLWHIRI